MKATRIALVFAAVLAGAALAFGQDARALVMQAHLAYDNKEYAKSAQLFSDAIAKGAKSPGTFYDAACSYALAGDANRAFELLDGAVSRGFRDSTHMAGDTDLASLHADSRWKAVMARCEAAHEAYLKTINAELAGITDADQADRQGDLEKADWGAVSKRDAERRARVYEILKAGQVKTADDYFNAALVLQHGDKPDDYDMAHKLAAKSAELDPNKMEARWLAAAAEDRYLQSVGKPQIYGTQFRKIDGKWTLEPFDEKAVTDEQRRQAGVPTVAETRKQLEQMNASPK